MAAVQSGCARSDRFRLKAEGSSMQKEMRTDENGRRFGNRRIEWRSLPAGQQTPFGRFIAFRAFKKVFAMST